MPLNSGRTMWLNPDRFSQLRRIKSEPDLKIDPGLAKENTTPSPTGVGAAATNDGRVSRASHSVRRMVCALKPAVQALWKKLRKDTSDIPNIVYSDDHGEASNSPNVRCVQETMVTVKFRGEDGKNQCHALHANHVEIETATTSGSQVNRYVAGQSPNPPSLAKAVNSTQTGEFFACEKLLVQGIESKMGVFQFVSPLAHFDPKQSNERTIIDQLMGQLEGENGKNGILIGGRYRVVKKDEDNPLRFPSGAYERGDRGPEYRCINIQVTDEVLGESFTVPLTQVGLKYTGGLLRVGDIKKADEIFEAHKKILSVGHYSEKQFNPAVISYAGVGRNATLIAYREIKALFKNKPIESVEALDAALGEIIMQGRKARGPHFVHSAAQLNELREALLVELGQEDKPVSPSVLSPSPPADDRHLPIVHAERINDSESEKIDNIVGDNTQVEGDIKGKTLIDQMPEDRAPLQDHLSGHANQASALQKSMVSNIPHGYREMDHFPELMRGTAPRDGDCFFHSVVQVLTMHYPNGNPIADQMGNVDINPTTMRRHIAKAMIGGFIKVNDEGCGGASCIYSNMTRIQSGRPFRIGRNHRELERFFINLFGSADDLEGFRKLNDYQKKYVIDVVTPRVWGTNTGDCMPHLLAAVFPNLCVIVHQEDEDLFAFIEHRTIGSPSNQAVHLFWQPGHYEPVVHRSANN